MDSRLWLRRGGLPSSSSDSDEAPTKFELDDLDPVDDLTLAPYVYQRLRATSFLLSRLRRSPSPPPSRSRPPHHQAKRACIAASSKAILGLKEVVLTKDDDDCAICLKALADRYQENDPASAEPTMSTLRAMPCSHVFHQHCIFEWLSHNSACPLCRHQLPTVEDDDDMEED